VLTWSKGGQKILSGKQGKIKITKNRITTFDFMFFSQKNYNSHSQFIWALLASVFILFMTGYLGFRLLFEFIRRGYRFGFD
jgi:hypothetical protein